MNENRLNLIPFYAAALAHATNIRKDIECLYSKKAAEYYIASKNSEFYEYSICKENSLLTEELFKKCLGFFCYLLQHQDDEETSIGVYNLFKKAYKKTYQFFKDRNPEDTSFADYITALGSYLSQKNDDTYLDNIAAFFFYSRGLCKGMDAAIDQMIGLLQSADYRVRREKWNRFLDENRDEVNALCRKLPSNALDMVLFPKEKDATGLHTIYQSEVLNSQSLFNELQLDKRDIKDVVVSYIVEKGFGRECSFEIYFLFALHLKAMCKAYNKVKEMYFQNNKETMRVEADALEKELQKSKAICKNQETQIQQLSEDESERNQQLVQENIRLQKEIRRLQNDMARIESDSKEVIALRSYVFGQSEKSEADVTSERVVSYSELDNLNGMVIGGFPGWQDKMRGALHSWKFVNGSTKTLDSSLFRNLDCVIFNVKCLNHSLYYNVMDIVRNSHVQIGYVNNDNVPICLKAIYKTAFAKRA